MSARDEDKPRTGSPRLPVLLAVLLPFIALAVLRAVTVRDAENAQDAFYHVTMADLGPAYCMSRTFPHMTMSVWTGQFSDKELLFHLLLSGVRGWNRLLRVPSGPPFHLETLFLTLLLLAAFACVARRFGVPHLPVFACLLVVICPFFTQRLIMLRPHLLAVGLMLLACTQFAAVRTRRGLWCLFAIGFVFAWSYSNPHFVLVPAVAFAVSRARRDPGFALAIVLATAAGIVAGYTIHPQFPNTFMNWKIQCVDVVFQSVSAHLPVRLGNELRPPELSWLVRNGLVLLLCLANSAGMYVLARREGVRRIDDTVLAVYLTSLLWTLAVFLSLRGMEYACPFTVLSAGLLAREWRRTYGPLLLGNLARGWVAIAAAVPLVVALTVGHVEQRRRTATARALSGFSVWAADVGLPAGTVIANPHWSDFPLLFFYAPQFRYLLGVDPMFGYAYRPEKVALLERFRRGEEWLAPEQLAALTESRFAFVSYYGWQLAQAMFRGGYALVYEGDDGWLFDLMGPPSGSRRDPDSDEPSTETPVPSEEEGVAD